MSVQYNAGYVTAYGSAVRGGYEGTYQQWCEDMAELGKVVGDLDNFSVSVETLGEGEQATASYSDGVLALGIPKGDTGYSPKIEVYPIERGHRVVIFNEDETTTTFDVMDGIGISSVVLNSNYTLTFTYSDGTTYTTTSIRGQTGATPQISIGMVETLNPGDNATVTISGTDEQPVLNFGIPKGEQGDVNLQQLYAVYPHDEVNAAIASFPDGANNIPVISLVYTNEDLVQVEYRADINLYIDKKISSI